MSGRDAMDFRAVLPSIYPRMLFARGLYLKEKATRQHGFGV
jgi:hypothetical protein